MRVPTLLCLVFINISTICAGNHRSLTGSRDGRIVGGHDAAPRSHPYLVSLQLRFLWARMRLCSASLLSERWILTAGHCVKGSWLMNWLTMEAIVGTSDMEKKDSTSQTVRISERIPHPNYDGGIGSYDIAMLKTATDIVYNSAVFPIEVPLSMGSFTQKTENLMLAGWGVLETTLFIPSLSDKLQEVRVEYLPFKECSSAIDAIKEPNEDNPLDKLSNICTGPITGGVAACSGDSGGPLIQYIKETSTATSPQTTEEYDTTDWSDNDSANHPETTTVTLPPTTEENGTTSWIDDSANEVEDTSVDRKTSITTKKAPVVKNMVQNYKDEGYIPVVIGVVSWGIVPCGEVGAPTVYTNVTTYADFINKHIYS